MASPTRNPKNLKQKTIDSAIWTIAGYGAGQILRLGANLALATVLEPQYFGLVAVVHILLMGILLFSDIGIAQSIINHPQCLAIRYQLGFGYPIASLFPH